MCTAQLFIIQILPVSNFLKKKPTHTRIRVHIYRK